MSENKQTKDLLPDSFASIEEAAEFWDTHSLADYWDETEDVEMEVRAPQRQWVPLASSLREPLLERARREGISVETLINLWVAERLQVGV